MYSSKWLIYRIIVHGLKQFQKSWWQLVWACRLSSVLLNTSRLCRHSLSTPLFTLGNGIGPSSLHTRQGKLSGMQYTFGVGGITPSDSLCPNVHNNKTQPLSFVGCSTQRAWPMRGACRWCVNSSAR